MNKEIAQLLCESYQIGRLMMTPVKIGEYSLWRIETEQGVYVIKQVTTDLGEQYVKQGERIANAFAIHGVSVVTALSHQENVVAKFNGKGFLVFKWKQGQVFSCHAVKSEYAYRIGKLLAQLHTVRIRLPNIGVSHWQIFSLDDRNELLANLSLLPHDLDQSNLIKVSVWMENYFAAQQQISRDLVISHGDLTQANIIWDANNIPWIIDWEAAGWIHPQIELVGVLINWAGINLDELNKTSFKNVIKGYCAGGGNITIDETILWASFGSWFAWLLFNAQQCSITTSSKTVVINTIQTLHRLTSAFPKILAWINSC